MIKRLFLIAAAVALLVSLPAAAVDYQQKEWYGNGVLAFPTGDFGDIANFGIGAGIGVLVPHTADISFRGEISYIYFTTEDFEGADVSASMVPIMVLAQYNLKDSQAYLLGGLGLAFATAKVEFDTPGYDDSDTSTELGLTLGGGFQMQPNLGLEGRLNLISDANFISINVAYKF